MMPRHFSPGFVISYSLIAERVDFADAVYKGKEERRI